MTSIITSIGKTNSVVNYPYSYDSIRVFLLMLSAVFIGYTLQPVPKWLNHLFDTSDVFKFVILFMTATLSVYPVSFKNFTYCVLFSIVILGMFKYFRHIDDEIEKKKDDS